VRASCKQATLNVDALDNAAANAAANATTEERDATAEEHDDASDEHDDASDEHDAPRVDEAPTEPEAKTPHARATLEQPSTATWTELARRGHYREAYALIGELDVVSARERLGAGDLWLLAETARLTGHTTDARSSLHTLRYRFGGTNDATRAAFSLGQLSAQSGDHRQAATWFGSYLSEAPEGALAAAALGRLLEARVALGDPEAARDAARQYLERYPHGAHAESARQVLRTSDP